jgi:hypothetical protein
MYDMLFNTIYCGIINIIQSCDRRSSSHPFILSSFASQGAGGASGSSQDIRIQAQVKGYDQQNTQP